MVELLQSLASSLMISTYQVGRLLVVRANDGKLSMLNRSFDQLMGMTVDARQMALGTRDQIWILRNAPDIAVQLDPPGKHDACYLPRVSYVTGDVRVHEMEFAGDDLWFVNTRFSCLATLDENYSFIPRWRPPFVSAIAAEDRCHLNGMTIVDG